MIHGAKLLNKNKICKVLCIKKIKKIRKKITKKIENTQRRVEKSYIPGAVCVCACLKTKIEHTQHVRYVRILRMETTQDKI